MMSQLRPLFRHGNPHRLAKINEVAARIPPPGYRLRDDDGPVYPDGPAGAGNMEWLWHVVPHLKADNDRHFSVMTNQVLTGDSRLGFTQRPFERQIRNPDIGSILLRDLNTGKYLNIEEEGETELDARFAFRSNSSHLAFSRVIDKNDKRLEDTVKPHFPTLDWGSFFIQGGYMALVDSDPIKLILLFGNRLAVQRLGNDGWVDNRLHDAPFPSWASYAIAHDQQVMGVVEAQGRKINLSSDFGIRDHQSLHATAPFDHMSDLEKWRAISRKNDWATGWFWDQMKLSDGSRVVTYELWNPDRPSSASSYYAEHFLPDGERRLIRLRMIPTKWYTGGPEPTPTAWDLSFKSASALYQLSARNFVENNWLRVTYGGVPSDIVEGGMILAGQKTQAGRSSDIRGEGWHEHINMPDRAFLPPDRLAFINRMRDKWRERV